MATVSKSELKAALERAETHALADDDVALQTSSRLPKDVDGVEPAELDTAGSEQHGPVYSYTRAQVADAYRQLGGEPDAGVREGSQARQAQAQQADQRQAEADQQAQRQQEARAAEQQPAQQPSGPQATRRGTREQK